MKMKKIYKILLLIAVCIIAVSGCKKEDKVSGTRIYYTDSEGVSLVEKGTRIKGKTKKAQINYVLGKVQKNTDNINYRSAFVKGVKIKNWSLHSKNLTVDFNRAYQKLSVTEEIVLRASVVHAWTDRWSRCCIVYDRRRAAGGSERPGDRIYAAIGFCKKYRCESPFLSERDIFVVLW